MRVTEIHIEGSNATDRAFAVARRKRGSEYIEVELITPAGAFTHKVVAADAEDLGSMAEILQAALDGGTPTAKRQRAFFDAIKPLSDL